jgi:hypothetical protein
MLFEVVLLSTCVGCAGMFDGPGILSFSFSHQLSLIGGLKVTGFVCEDPLLIVPMYPIGYSYSTVAPLVLLRSVAISFHFERLSLGHFVCLLGTFRQHLPWTMSRGQKWGRKEADFQDFSRYNRLLSLGEMGIPCSNWLGHPFHRTRT